MEPPWLQVVLLLILSLTRLRYCASSQSGKYPTGFVSINCGGFNHTDPSTGFPWQTDDNYIFTGTKTKTRESPDSPGLREVLPLEMRDVRYFPASSSPRKNCYWLPTDPGKVYLIRAGFLCNAYETFTTYPDTAFNISLDGTFWNTVSCDSSSAGGPQYFEAVTAEATSSSISVCLIRLDNKHASFINSLESRILSNDLYSPEDYSLYVSNVHLFLANRVNFGEQRLTYRYPHDPWDRRWLPYVQAFPNMGGLRNLKTAPTRIRIAEGKHYDPPQRVMSTAIESPTISFAFPLPASTGYIYSILYFADLNSSTSDQRVMEGHFAKRGLLDGYVSIVLNLTDRAPPFSAFVMPVVAYAPSLGFDSTVYVPSLNVTFSRTINSTRDALLNAAELFVLRSVEEGTRPSDKEALQSIKRDMQLLQWTGDPCLPVPWDEITCTEGSFHEVSSLILSGRNISGPVPESIGNLSKLSILDLSDNQLTGPLPSSFASLARLTSLNLSSNNISGEFPIAVLNGLQNLQTLDVSNNQLTGSIPETLIEKLGRNNIKFSGNPGLSVCHLDGRGCPAPARVTLSSHSWLIAACVVAGVFFVLFLLPITYVCILYTSSTNGLFDRDYRKLQERLRKQGVKAQPYSLAKVRKATKGFKYQIGEGGFGSVYHGRLASGQEVAVKVMSHKSHQGRQEFLNEIELLSLVHHKHLVSLVGYCQAWRRKILVYEYLKGGDLHRRLHGAGTGGSAPLTWKDRTSIIMEVAEGLCYLHTGCKPGIIHRDVKSTNILLTEDGCARVADFGLSRMDDGDATHITTIVKGTTGYLDPEYYTSQKLTDKSDVYSFGILLLEIITGKPPITVKQSEQVHILELVRHTLVTGTTEDLADSRLEGDYSRSRFSRLVALALQCVQPSRQNRPAMTDVVQCLRSMGLEPRKSVNDKEGLARQKEKSAEGNGSARTGECC